MTQQPIAYADSTGYVTPVTVNTQISEHFISQLTPLYTQADIDASLARFYASQGLDADGNPVDVVKTTPEETAQVVHAEAAVREAQGKKITGQSIADAAAAALALKPTKG